jgi:hypothetical protein
MGGHLQGLGMGLSLRYKVSKDPNDLKAVHACYHDSFKTQTPQQPESSWVAALTWASFSEKFQPPYCLTAYSAAFNLLPEILWISQAISVRQDAIYRLNVGNATSTATRTCIKVSDLTSAVQFVEQGVATIFHQMLQLKPEFDGIPFQQVEDLKKHSHELYTGTSSDPMNAAIERKELLKKIRMQPGNECFLLPKPYSVLYRASQGGPVVILNSHNNSCDGIIIPNPTSNPIHVALPNITLHLLNSQQTIFKELLGRCNIRIRGESDSTRLFGYLEGFTSKTIEESFLDLLTWLWDNIVNPVYQVLALVSISKVGFDLD